MPQREEGMDCFVASLLAMTGKPVEKPVDRLWKTGLISLCRTGARIVETGDLNLWKTGRPSLWETGVYLS